MAGEVVAELAYGLCLLVGHTLAGFPIVAAVVGEGELGLGFSLFHHAIVKCPTVRNNNIHPLFYRIQFRCYGQQRHQKHPQS